MQPRDAHGGTPDGGDSWLRRATAVLSTYRLRVFVAQPDSNALQPPRSPHVPSDIAKPVFSFDVALLPMNRS